MIHKFIIFDLIHRTSLKGLDFSRRDLEGFSGFVRICGRINH